MLLCLLLSQCPAQIIQEFLLQILCHVSALTALSHCGLHYECLIPYRTYLLTSSQKQDTCLKNIFCSLQHAATAAAKHGLFQSEQKSSWCGFLLEEKWSYPKIYNDQQRELCVGEEHERLVAGKRIALVRDVFFKESTQERSLLAQTTKEEQILEPFFAGHIARLIVCADSLGFVAQEPLTWTSGSDWSLSLFYQGICLSQAACPVQRLYLDLKLTQSSIPCTSLPQTLANETSSATPQHKIQ